MAAAVSSVSSAAAAAHSPPAAAAQGVIRRGVRLSVLLLANALCFWRCYRPVYELRWA